MIDEYISKGWCIIPLVHNGKKPAVDWAKYHYHRPSKETVNQWFSNEEYNVGIVTGRVSNLVVIDVDTYRGGKLEDILEKYPTGLICKTGGGGYHLYYQHPGVAVSNQVGADGIDIRGDGGLVVAPPSIHHSGTKYEWLQYGQPAHFPPQLLGTSSDSKKKVQENWLTQTLSGVGSGQRNHSCSKLTGYLISKGLPVDIIKSILASWNMGNTPPMPLSEIHGVVDSTYKTHSRKIEIEFDLEDRLPLLPMADFIAKYEQNVDTWLIQDWIPAAAICFVVADPQTYKSWLLYDLAISIACDIPYLGSDVVSSGPVIMMQLEDSSHMTANRNIAILNSRVGGKHDVDVHWLDGNPFRLDDDMSKLAATIEQLRPKAVIIDPLYATLGADSVTQYMADVATKLAPMRMLRDKYHCAFIIAHHTKKNKTGGQGDMWGSNLLNAAKEAMWLLESVSNNVIKVNRRYKASASPEDVELTFMIDTTSEDKSEWTYDVSVSEFSVEDNDSSDYKVYKAIKDGHSTTKSISDHTGIPKKRCIKIYKKLMDRGVVMKQGSGMETKYTVSPGEEDYEFVF